MPGTARHPSRQRRQPPARSPRRCSSRRSRWQIFHDDGIWWATRGGLEERDGPRSLIRRVHASADLTVLADKLCAQDWLDQLDDDALAAVYHGSPPEPTT
jgi:hypothetical protein